MAPKSNKQNVAPTAIENQEPEAKTLYSRAEKSELIAEWQLAGDKVKLVEKQLEEAKHEKSNAAFELQKAFGEAKFSVGGILMRVVKKTNKTTKETGYFVREISLKADEEF